MARSDTQERPRVRGLLFGLFILLAASLVAFPTIACVQTFVLGLLALFWLWRKRPQPKRLGWTVVGVTAAAWALAMVSYYGQYVVILINTTLPALLNPQAAAAKVWIRQRRRHRRCTGVGRSICWDGRRAI